MNHRSKFSMNSWIEKIFYIFICSIYAGSLDLFFKNNYNYGDLAFYKMIYESSVNYKLNDLIGQYFYLDPIFYIIIWCVSNLDLSFTSFNIFTNFIFLNLGLLVIHKHYKKYRISIAFVFLLNFYTLTLCYTLLRLQIAIIFTFCAVLYDKRLFKLLCYFFAISTHAITIVFLIPIFLGSRWNYMKFLALTSITFGIYYLLYDKIKFYLEFNTAGLLSVMALGCVSFLLFKLDKVNMSNLITFLGLGLVFGGAGRITNLFYLSLILRTPNSYFKPLGVIAFTGLSIYLVFKGGIYAWISLQGGDYYLK